MWLFELQNWPLLFICVGMLAAAIIDWWKYKVPNWLTFSLIFTGWLAGAALNDYGVLPWANAAGGFGASLAGTAVGLALMLPIYSIGGMGAGDVKMTMGFGAWIGAFYGAYGNPEAAGLVNPGALYIIFWAFCVGTIAGGIIALGMIVARGSYRTNLLNFREILGDMVKSSSISEVNEKAQRRPRWHRLPYGVPLCIGFLTYLFWLNGF